MMKFDSEAYRNDIYKVTNHANDRRLARGFAPLVIDFVDKCMNNDPSYGMRCPSILELGIGGGGSHEQWSKHTSGKVFGLDIFDPERSKSTGTYEKGLKNYKDARSLFSRLNNVTAVWDTNSFDPESATRLQELNFGQPFDVIVDDSQPGFGGSTIGLIATWKDYIADSGIIISETPFGNGVDVVYSLAEEERNEYLALLAEQGMIVFYTREYADETIVTNFPVYYLAVYVKDFDKYSDVIKKYENNIVAGKENWKHNNGN